MKKISLQHRQFVEEKAPRFVEAVDQVKQSSTPPQDNPLQSPSEITIRLAAFRGDITLLYAALWYADSHNVPILFTPTGRLSRLR